jgi:hypothetical protein
MCQGVMKISALITTGAIVLTGALSTGAAMAPAASAASARPVVYSGTRGWHVSAHGRPRYIDLDAARFHGGPSTFITGISWANGTGTFHSVQTGTPWHTSGHVSVSQVHGHNGVQYYRHLRFNSSGYSTSYTWRNGHWRSIPGCHICHMPTKLWGGK